MRSIKSRFGLPLLWALMSISAANISCAVHVYRVYDPYHGDYHVWDDREGVYYNQWVGENHLEHRDFRKLSKDDQKRYWDWRHNHR